MVKKGRLNNTEKYAIQGMLAQDVDIDSICSELDRSERVVRNYVEGELTDILGTIDKSRRQAEKNKPKTEKKSRRRFSDIDEDEIHRIQEDIEDETVVPEVKIDPRVRREAYSQLVQAGLTERDAGRIIDAAVEACEKAGRNIPNSKILFTECIKRMNAGHFITKKTQGGKEGVAVMSSAASQRMDEAYKQHSKQRVTRSGRGNVFDPSTGEIL